ncbi:phosphohexomutase domain-containing protein [Desulfogranum japonicum]|uniref:phosphoglucomutase n=1 Tax=Desulfogranum japonicum TaxID=231447 RepID=UPI0004026FF1|nr:phosphoglucomutase [Desulfogranum japonicum]
MSNNGTTQGIIEQHITSGNHAASDYFAALKTCVSARNNSANDTEQDTWQRAIDTIYTYIEDEILTNTAQPVQTVKFGTSGWRGILGKDIFVQSVAYVTCAILQLYKLGEGDQDIHNALGKLTYRDMQKQGCVVGFDNRFGGELLARAVVNILCANEIKVYYAGESTTGALSASVLRNKAAFSINLTPSHNPMEYGGFKYNAADAGPAAPILTDTITATARDFLTGTPCPFMVSQEQLKRPLDSLTGIIEEDALASWQDLVTANSSFHGINYAELKTAIASRDDLIICVDAVHGASRNYLHRLLGDPEASRLTVLRDNADPTFGGIAPEPSSANMQPTIAFLNKQSSALKIGAIIDPDGDRIRFTDGKVEISMNQFGAMAYHFLHEVKQKKGMVAKTVASSNLANAVAEKLGEKVFEPRVGFKEFKPVLNKALVCFEESDGISITGHTPEKDAFIGLILAIDMVLTQNISLGEYLHEIEQTFGHYYPGRGGITVSQQGKELLQTLEQLEVYARGTNVQVGENNKKIREVIDIDGRKMIFDDGSWIMIRPSGTEPKVRFYVEARDPEETELLVKSAHSMLAQIGLLP